MLLPQYSQLDETQFFMHVTLHTLWFRSFVVFIGFVDVVQ